jgi:hypothetical protein
MGVAGTRSGTGPNGYRAQGLEGVGKNGSANRWACRSSCRKGLERHSHGGNAGSGMAWGPGDGERRDGFPDACGHTPLAIIGSGHCLQSRISHDSFLVGYDWGELGCGCSGSALRPGFCPELHGRLYNTGFVTMSRVSAVVGAGTCPPE